MKQIVIGLSPNLETDDIFLTLRRFFSPLNLQAGNTISKLEQWFRQYFHVSYAVSFVNARSALYVILKSIGIKPGDEVIIQGFTCVVVPNSVLATGARPIYSDINDSYTIDTKDLVRKITNKTKAIIVQHTFGIASDMEKIQAIAKKNNLFVIEDVAHTIGGEFKGKKLGTLSDAAIFSFGRDKAFSSVFGGVAITDNTVLGKKIRDYQQGRPFPSIVWILQQLCHPVLTGLILPIYGTFLGKAILVFFQKIKFLSFPVNKSEKRGIFLSKDVYKMPNALSVLAYNQVRKITRYNLRRKEITGKYQEAKLSNLEIKNNSENFLLRYPFLVNDVNISRNFFRKQGVYLGDWYANVVDPKGTDMNAIFYKKGSCPVSEKLARHTSNLPILPAMTNADIEKVINVVKKYVGN